MCEMEPPPRNPSQEEDEGHHPEDADGLTGAEELLDQPDEDTMEHSGLQKVSVVMPTGNTCIAASRPSEADSKSVSSPPTSANQQSSYVNTVEFRTDTVGGMLSGSGSFTGGSSDEFRTDSVGGKYVAIKNYRADKLSCPDLMGGHSANNSQKLFFGSFRNCSDFRADLTFEVNDIATMSNTSSTFDLKTFDCNNCKKHSVMHRGSAAGAGGGDDREVIVLSDQNFPAALPASSSGKKCVAVLRIEFGSLSELTDLFLSIASSAHFNAGSVVVIMSASHLARVGTAAYCGDLVRAKTRILDFLGTGYFIAPGPFLLGGGTNDRGLIQSLAEVYCWLADQADESGVLLLKDSYLAGLRQLEKNGFSMSGKAPIKLCLPVSLANLKSSPRTSWVGTDSIATLEPLSAEDESTIITAFISSLVTRLALNLCQSPMLDRGPGLKSGAIPSPDQILLVGASHSRHMAQYFDMAGIPVTCVSIPGWRATAGKAEAMTKLVEDAVAGFSPDSAKNTVAIFQLLDNTVYMTRTEDGGLMPCRKEASSNKYHVDGEVMLAPKELLKDSINICTPIIRAVGDMAKIFLVPLPRYTRSGCCNDNEHATNSANPEYVKQLLLGLDSMRRQIKDMCFAANLRNLVVVNLGRSVESEAGYWGADPVHLLADGYGLITSRLIDEATNLLSSHKSHGKQNPSALERSRKRQASRPPDNDNKKTRPHNFQSYSGQQRPPLRGRWANRPPYNRGQSHSGSTGWQFNSRGGPHHRGRGFFRSWRGRGH